ncbi:hypothetical protein EDD86DRAFT_224169 [Gorgonomyces haynaldii]|nr:hypothetical protein EDD86DRAFT_224169 [Gorgonomyces haynaldii]
MAHQGSNSSLASIGSIFMGGSLASLFENKAPNPDFKYTVEVDEPAKPGEGKARKYAKLEGKTTMVPPHVTNLHENLLNAVQIAGDRPFLGHRPVTNGQAGPYVWQTYSEVLKRVSNLGAGLVAKGYKPDTNIGLFSINRPEWVIAEHACYMYGLVTVPLYDTLGVEAVEYILSSTKTPVVVATADKAKLLLEWSARIPTVGLIVVMNTPTDELIQKGKAAGVSVISMADLEKEGSEKKVEKPEISGSTVATLCYTSGTTGLPKGVILTHNNLLSFVASYVVLSKAGDVTTFTSQDIHISYLPLAHVFERIIQCAMMYVGAAVGFYQGDTLKLLDDVAELKPTIFPSVPRLYNRIYDKILAGVKQKGGITQYLFNRAFAAKKAYLARGYQTHSFWDSLVFNKVKQRLGGRVRFMVSGAAPISPDVIDFMRICFGATFLEGYGQTETTGAATITLNGDLTSGHVGIPIPSCTIKLRDVPSMNYTSRDEPFPRGEIMIKGHNCFSGYYKAPDKTAETIVDGWVATGDVGMWDHQGRLKIIDRVKNIFKLAQGEYIAPEKIEIVYNKHELIAQSFVYGDSLQSVLVAIIVPDWDTVKGWAQSKGWKADALSDVTSNEAAKKELLKLIQDHGKANNLQGFENVKAIHLIDEPFSPENGILSPTFKLKRHEAKAVYIKEIEAMYAALTK